MRSKIGLDEIAQLMFYWSTKTDMSDLSRFWRSCLGLAPKSFKIILLTKLSPLSVPDAEKMLCALYLHFHFPLQQILNTCIVVYCTSSNISFHLNIWTQALWEGVQLVHRSESGMGLWISDGTLNHGCFIFIFVISNYF